MSGLKTDGILYHEESFAVFECVASMPFNVFFCLQRWCEFAQISCFHSPLCSQRYAVKFCFKLFALVIENYRVQAIFVHWMHNTVSGSQFDVGSLGQFLGSVLMWPEGRSSSCWPGVSVNNTPSLSLTPPGVNVL